MDSIPRPSSWQVVAIATSIYLVSRSAYRLFFHPLAGYPGPKLAAMTRCYEAYYDIVKDGHFEMQIENMHEKYGPVVRISPSEIHFSGSDSLQNFARQQDRWDKYNWNISADDESDTITFTASHDQ